MLVYVFVEKQISALFFVYVRLWRRTRHRRSPAGVSSKNYYFFRKNSGRIIKSTSYVAFEKFVKICWYIILYDKDSEKKEVILLLVKAYPTGLSHFANETTDSKKPKNANERVMKEFIALLSSPSAIHMPLDYYARILNISPKHLSFISRYSTGFNALHWIDQ